MKNLILLLLAGCYAQAEPTPDPEPARGSNLRVHYCVNGGLLITGPVWHTIIREDGSVLVEIKNKIRD